MKMDIDRRHPTAPVWATLETLGTSRKQSARFPSWAPVEYGSVGNPSYGWVVTLSSRE